VSNASSLSLKNYHHQKSTWPEEGDRDPFWIGFDLYILNR